MLSLFKHSINVFAQTIQDLFGLEREDTCTPKQFSQIEQKGKFKKVRILKGLKISSQFDPEPIKIKGFLLVF